MFSVGLFFDIISAAINQLIAKEQAVFQKGISCGDHIFYITADHGIVPGIEHASLCKLRCLKKGLL